MYTIDASVWVNGFDKREQGYEYSYRLLEIIRQNNLPIFVPNLVLAEVAGAISRTRQNPTQAMDFVTALRDLANVTLAPIDSAFANQAFHLAARHKLRGADAMYAVVAKQYNCILVSLDNEHLTHLADVVTVQTPEAILQDHIDESENRDSESE